MLVLFRFKHHPPPPTPAHPTEVVRALSPPPTPCQVSCWPRRGPPHSRGVAVAWPVTGIREIRRCLAVVGPLVFEFVFWGWGAGDFTYGPWTALSSIPPDGRRASKFNAFPRVMLTDSLQQQRSFDGHTGEELGQSPPTSHTWC